MDDDSDQTLTEDVRALVRPLVARGDRPFANILGEAVEHILEEHEGADEDTVKQVCEQETDKAFAAHLAAQAGWPEVTDCDRLDQAFEALNGRDIVALHDFTCCQTCGLAEVGAPIQAAVDAGIDVAGFTFYHAQDTDSAVDGHGLYLTYGHVDGSETNGIAIGRLVVHALNEAGLETDWTERSESASPCASTGGGAFRPRPSSVWSARRIARPTRSRKHKRPGAGAPGRSSPDDDCRPYSFTTSAVGRGVLGDSGGRIGYSMRGTSPVSECRKATMASTSFGASSVPSCELLMTATACCRSQTLPEWKYGAVTATLRSGAARNTY